MFRDAKVGDRVYNSTPFWDELGSTSNFNNEEFDWKNAKYPCLGINLYGDIIRFSSYGVGHSVDLTYEGLEWDMNYFKPYNEGKNKLV